MASTTPITLRLPYGSDMHVHLRQGDLMEMVTPKIVQGGISTVFVMPNLQPPITSVQQALAYQEKLETLAPEVTFLMSLYLCPELTPDEIRLAAQAGIVGVKSYPRGVTTNSEAGIESYTTYYPVFAAMQEVGMVLNLHGEVPSDRDHDICVLNAEAKFLTHLQAIHQAFPDLWIVLEHATTREAVDMVKSLGPTVGCTITVHHLELVVDDWAGFHHHFCKPVAKFPHDRAALREVIREGHPRFFLGSDSAPHPRHAKENAQTCAGVFTTPLVMPYLATILDSFGALDRLRGFACDFGRQFYGLPPHPIDLPLDYPSIQLARRPAIQDPTDSVNNATYVVPTAYPYSGKPSYAAESAEVSSGKQQSRPRGGEVVPFWAGHTLEWRLSL